MGGLNGALALDPDILTAFGNKTTSQKRISSRLLMIIKQVVMLPALQVFSGIIVSVRY